MSMQDIDAVLIRSRAYAQYQIGHVYHVDGGLALIEGLEDVPFSMRYGDGVVVLVRVFRPMLSFVVPLFQARSRELYEAGTQVLSTKDIIEDRTLTLLFTNHAFPKFSEGPRYGLAYKVRWRCQSRSIHEGRIVRLQPSVGGKYCPDPLLRQKWCGDCKVRYTMADVFCGAGGASRGAVQAGFNPIWALDNDEMSARTYAANFPNTIVEVRGIDQLCASMDLKVDLLHISPPCQGFSMINTAPEGGQHGSTNRDLSLSILNTIKAARPRFVTIEQVPGILSVQHRLHFDTLIRTFVEDLGFSVQWKVINCIDYGVPATRKRLVIIASCPGQSLPAWPDPTPRRLISHYLPRADLETTFNGTLLASRIPRHHSLDRGYSIPEVAAIQSFPPNHVFLGSRAQRMRNIGNAVPPSLAKAIFVDIAKCLAEGS